MATIPLEDFVKLELRVAKVLAVDPHPNADRLYLLTVDGGEERQIVAGLRGHYEPEQLLGKSIVVVWNLEPATIRGVESNGMLLAVQDGNKVSVLTPDQDIAPGAKVS